MTADLFESRQLSILDKVDLRIAELSLARLTDAGTLSRAKSYVDAGAVVEIALEEVPVKLSGVVTGSGRNRYIATVSLRVSEAGMVVSLAGSCTCPVGTNCKHVLALVITAFRHMRTLRAAPELRIERVTERGRSVFRQVGRPLGTEPPVGGVRPAPGRALSTAPVAPPRRPTSGSGALTVRSVPAKPAPWISSMAVLLGDGFGLTEDAGEPLGLQVELTRKQSTGPADQTVPVDVSLGLRPVVLNAKGKWIRTGISWDRLGGYQYGRPRANKEHVRLLSEISVLHSLTGANRYSYGVTSIHLQDLNSRRIWDLLAEARSIGIALVQSGKAQLPVMLSDGDAELTLELLHDDGDLVIRPSISLDGTPTGPTSYALLGTPVHGVALWGADTVDLNNSGLTLVRTQQRLTPEVETFLGRGSVRIPRADEELFIRDYLPTIARRTPLVCVDGSVQIPEAEPATLTLTVTGHPGDRLNLRWEWQYRIGQATTTVPLWPVEGDRAPREREHERTVVGSLPLSVAESERLTEQTHLGRRLAPECWLERMTAVEFLAETVPRLRELDHVELTLVNEQTYREATELPIVSISNSQSPDDHDWFDLGITVSIDGQNVHFNGLFMALAAGDEHMILPSGTYFALDREPFRTLRRLIEEARALQDVPGRSLRINKFQASLWNELQELGVVTGQAEAWQRSVGGLLAGDELVEQPVPESLLAELRPYQQLGLDWLTFLYEHDLGGVLADDMGLGKTVQTLGLICHAKERDPAGAPFLVVAPTSVVGNWAAECVKFAPDLRVLALTETLSRGGVDLGTAAPQVDVVITSYALFRLDYEDYAEQTWSGLILDEAQFIKNHLSQGYRCAKKLPVPFKLAITGTPVENNLMELWSMFSITAPGLFTQSGRFKEYYQRPIERNGDSDRLAQLRRRIRPLMLRRTKEQVAPDLPAKQEQVIELELNPKHRKVYQMHLQRERQKVLGLINDMDKNRFVIFRSLTLLRQLSLDASLIDPKYSTIPSTKLDALMEQVQDIVSEGHRTLIFSQFTGFLDKVRQRMDAAGVEYCYLDGSTRHRPVVLAEFKTGTAPVFLISLKAGGVGLNLTEADYCILLDPWWNPATEAQAVDRVHRIGQTKNVMVYRLVAKDTIEEKVMALKEKKSKLFNSVMESGAAHSSALTAADIRQLLS